jgi:hypothetical protein
MPALATAEMVRLSSGQVITIPAPIAAGIGMPKPSSVVVGAVPVYVFLRVPTAAAASAVSVNLEVAAVPGVPAVERRQRTTLQAVAVV